jgi:hypothetical protein
LSFLTKLFVVLLVICSLMQTAAIVVYVNRSEDVGAVNKKLAKDVADARQLANSVQNTNSQMQAQMTADAKSATEREGELARKITDSTRQIQDANAQSAQAQKESQIKDATIAGTADALKSAQEENKGLQSLTAELRTQTDGLLRQNGELNIRLTDLDNRNRVLARSDEFDRERISELETQVKAMQQHGATPAGAGGAAEAAPTPPGPISTKVSAVDIIGGKKWATIGVGSADNVQKGMKFNVINSKTGEFLGFLTVERVEINESIGQVEGAKIDKIEKGVEAKTQL